jgi:F0F1-type ATP synthase assembly protein I
MNVWQSFARLSGVAFQVFAAVGLGILAGLGVDRLVPATQPAGVLVGAAIGFAGGIYLMVRGMRAYVSSEGPVRPGVRPADHDDEETES